MEDRANDLEALRLSMEVAAANGDFERAADLRDRISLLRGASHTYQPLDFDTPGLGASQQRVTPPPGLTPPRSPIR